MNSINGPGYPQRLQNSNKDSSTGMINKNNSTSVVTVVSTTSPKAASRSNIFMQVALKISTFVKSIFSPRAIAAQTQAPAKPAAKIQAAAERLSTEEVEVEVEKSIDRLAAHKIKYELPFNDICRILKISKDKKEMFREKLDAAIAKRKSNSAVSTTTSEQTQPPAKAAAVKQSQKALSTKKKEIRAAKAQESKLSKENIATIKKKLSALKKELNLLRSQIRGMKETDKAPDQQMEEAEANLVTEIETLESKLKK